MVVHIPHGSLGKDEGSEKKHSDDAYVDGYQSRISEIAQALSNKNISATAKDSQPQAETLPDNLAIEMRSLVAAAVKVGEVIQYFHDVANKTNLFALKVTSDALKSNDNSKVLALEVQELADETSKSAEKIYACMYSIQQTIVNMADERFGDYKHMAIGQNIFNFNVGSDENSAGKIPQNTLNTLVSELDKLRSRQHSDDKYEEIGDFASQLHQQIDDLKKQLLATG